MRTITFYSYKGGVGRSLLVANTAKYLSILGKKVFALDLDLEAPGLNYKFELGQDTANSNPRIGVVDILTTFLEELTFPNSINSYTTKVEFGGDTESIYLMRAGTAPAVAYWRQLSKINWYDLFFSENALGVPFFLELKERIRREFDPDFLLIDSRTGLTEMGGIATTLLPDCVVCLALTSFEHLEGLRAVMLGIKHTTSRPNAPVKLIPVISRVPSRTEVTVENEELDHILSVLNAPAREGSLGLQLDEIVALHSEPALDSGEQLLVGGKRGPHELPLLRDYLRLFTKIIPPEETRPHVGRLIDRALSRLLDDPDGAQSTLEELTAYCADEHAYRALIKLYQLRKVPLEKIVSAAALMWQLSSYKSDPDPVLVDVVNSAFVEARSAEALKRYADFAEGVWRASGMKDYRVGLALATSYTQGRKKRAIQLLFDYLDTRETPNQAVVVRLLELLRSEPTLSNAASSLIDRFKANSTPDFQAAWTKYVVERRDRDLAIKLMEDPLYRIEAVRENDPLALYRLLKVAGNEPSPGVLNGALSRAVKEENLSRLSELAGLFEDEGRSDEFEAQLKPSFPAAIIKDLLHGAKRRPRSWNQPPWERGS